MAQAALKQSPDSPTNQTAERIRKSLESIGPDKPLATLLAGCAVISSGHLLLEDVPGIGKTTFIKGIARILGLEMKRIQFTSDVLPSDILGSEIYDPKTQEFVFHPGPVFSQILLADELNRASPRTQSALLEAMGEGFVTINGRTERLPKPFVVFATQNPNDSIGTYPLPESQLDRFAARIKLDYPSKEREEAIFRSAALDPLASVQSAGLSAQDLQDVQSALEQVVASDRVVAYAKRFVDRTRHHEAIRTGVSTRGGVGWLRMAKAKALMEGRMWVTPDDLKTLAVPCLGHRISPRSGIEGTEVISTLLNLVAID
jgi:MoxR-like ATPase